MIKDVFEKVKDIWPENEPLDFVDKELSVIPDGAVNSEDIQRIVDWMARVKQNYPELYVNQSEESKK